MLMHAHRGAVDHLHIAVVGLADRSHDAVPNPGLAPAHKAVVAGRRRPEFFVQRPPAPCPPPTSHSPPPQNPSAPTPACASSPSWEARITSRFPWESLL